MKRTINVEMLARVEGEGALTIELDQGRATDVKLRIFEPPRLYEAFLKDRSYREAPDFTARICGICPIAYQMSACHAVEDAFGVTLPAELSRMRRLLYCGEWIASHALHMFMLHAPDFLGFQDVAEMSRRHRDRVLAGLAIKKAGNALVKTLGGREVHPVNVRIGGFYRAPTAAELKLLLPPLADAQAHAEAALQWMAGFDFPEFERDYEFVSLKHERDYPFCEGRLVSNKGLDIAVADYDRYFEERQVPYSTALHSVLRERGAYVVGPLARLNLCFDQLRPAARRAAESVGLTPPVLNPFRTLLARGVEVIQTLDEARAIIESYEPPASSFVEAEPVAGIGYGATEAPRGTLYHRYRLGGLGTIIHAKLVPPTSQNQKSIEDDLFELAPDLCTLDHEAATWRAEQAIRNYDPCISCSTHFLKLKLEERSAQ